MVIVLLSPCMPALLCVSLSSIAMVQLVRHLSPKVPSARLFFLGVFLALLDNGVPVTPVPPLELLQVEEIARVLLCPTLFSL